MYWGKLDTQSVLDFVGTQYSALFVVEKYIGTVDNAGPELSAPQQA
jgi:hypothetical protein